MELITPPFCVAKIACGLPSHQPLHFPGEQVWSATAEITASADRLELEDHGCRQGIEKP